MKRVLLYVTAVLISGSLTGQIATGPGLVAGNSDFIGHTAYIPWNANPLLIEAGPKSFYWIGGSNNVNVAHPKLTGAISDFDNIFFIKYDEEGVSGPANFIQGTYEMLGAFSYKGGLTVVGEAYEDVSANGNPIPIGNASMQEFIVNYNSFCQFREHRAIWELGPNEYPNSTAQMDKRDGSIYIAGTSSTPLNVKDYGIIGEGMDNYIYVIKYGHDLGIKWVYFRGFDNMSGEYGYVYNLVITPDINNNVIITGVVEGDRNLVFGNDTIPDNPENYALFALKLDQLGKKVWVNKGTAEGYMYSGDTYIFKGIAMKNGDVILAGVTSNGHFKLRDVEFRFENGANYANQFAFRLAPDGTSRWKTSFQNMGQSYGEGKKGTNETGGTKGSESEEFMSEIHYDVIKWNEDVLYMTGTFMSDSFEVAGKAVDKKLNTGIFVAGMEIGVDACEQVWGYGLSSDWVSIYGFDCDATGNVSLMGRTSQNQDFDMIQPDITQGADHIFHVGLDYNGVPLWHNNAYMEGLGSGINGVDLEVLPDGNVFSSITLSVVDNMNIGGKSLMADYNYSSWLVPLISGSELGGNVSTKFEEAEPAQPVYPGYVRAYKSTRRGAYPMVDSAWMDEAGDFLFTGLYPGKYTLQVVVDPADYNDKSMPTYLGNAVRWSEAQFIDIETDTKANFMNISLFQLNQVSTVGKGKMSGNVSYENDGILKSTAGDPVTKTKVILIKKASAKKSTMGEGDVVVAQVETDEDLGDYVFVGVPDGEYILIVDIVGLPMLNFYEVVIEGNKIVEGLDFTVGGEGINTSGNVDVKTVEMEHLMMFPNPGDGNIYLGIPESGDYLIRVYSTDGRLVRSENLESVTGLWKLDISDAEKGIYLISIKGGSGTQVMKYILQ